MGCFVLKKQLMEKYFNYALELAGNIANHFNNNNNYNNVRVYCPNFGKGYSEDFINVLLTNYGNYNPTNNVTLIIDASHIKLEEKAMQPRVVLHYLPRLNLINITTVSVEEDFPIIINKDKMGNTTAVELALYYYELSNTTQQYYEKMIKSLKTN